MLFCHKNLSFWTKIWDFGTKFKTELLNIKYHNLQQIKNTIYNNFTKNVQPLPSVKPSLPRKRTQEQPKIQTRSFGTVRNLNSRASTREAVCYLSGCVPTDKAWFDLCEFFSNQPALSGISLSEPKTAESLGRFFFECCTALDGDARYDNVVDLIEPLLEQNHAEIFENAIEVFEKLTEWSNNLFTERRINNILFPKSAKYFGRPKFFQLDPISSPACPVNR